MQNICSHRIFFYLISEYYRFLRIQEQCRLKWQATTDKFTQLLKEHEKCATEKKELIAELKHVDHSYQLEKERRRLIEQERNFYVSSFW